ncbi:MAG: cell wall hydrolase [Anaerocolumna sp.]
MKFRKLLLCMFAGMFLAGFANIYTYAAEEGNVVTEENTINHEVDTVIAASNTVADLATAADITDESTHVTESADKEEETADISETTDTSEETEETAQEAIVEESEEDKEATKETTSTETTKKSNKKTTTTETTKETAKKATTKKATTKKETVNYTKAELRLLSALIYCEANGETYNGKLAVAIVVMNRVRSSAFPDSVKGVIYQKYQFGPVSNGALDKQLAAYDAGKYTNSYELACIKAAKAALNGTKSITVSGKTKDFSKFLFFSGRLRNATFTLGNHQFK